MSHPETIDVADLRAQLAAIDAKLDALAAAQAAAVKPVLSTTEAMQLAGCESESAYYRWASTWGVTSSGNGRWPRQRIEKGLYNEAHGLRRNRARADRRAAA